VLVDHESPLNDSIRMLSGPVVLGISKPTAVQELMLAHHTPAR
jgi:hypothetical protein